MKDIKQESELPLVFRETETKQGGDVRARWAWTEPAVWTERMLTALERGIKGGVWFSLIDKVYSLANLRVAFARVKANRGAAGCDHQTIAMYEADLETNLADLSDQLRSGTYRPRRIRRVYIPKPGSRERRPLGIPTVRDRIVQTALRSVIEPIFERDFAEHSYGFRPNRGCKDALRRVDALLKAGYTNVVDADLKGYFETSSYYTPVHEGRSKSPGCLSKTFIRKPLRLPRRTCTAASSPRFTRCMIVWRETPRIRIALNMST